MRRVKTAFFDTSYAMGCLIEDEAELDKLNTSENAAEKVPFVENIRNLWLAGFGCDVYFAVGLECKRFAAHRIILAAGSKYFYDFFYGSDCKAARKAVVTNTNELPIEIFDVTSDAMNIVLNFLYSNQDPSSVELDSKSVVHVLYAAEKYQLKNLRLACLHHMQDINGKNCVDILRQAMFYKEEVLIKKCLNVIDENADLVLNSEGFLDCDRDTVAILINRETFKPSREFPLFMALFSWSIAECDRLGLDITAANQRDVLGGLMILVNLKALTKDEVADAVRTGLVTLEEVAQFVANPWDPKIKNVFEEIDDSDSGFQQLSVSKQGYVTISLNNNDAEEDNPPSDPIVTKTHIKPLSDGQNELYYTVSRFQHNLKSPTTTNSVKLTFQVNRNVDIVGFSIFGFCSGRNNEIFQYKPYVTIRRQYSGLHVAPTDRLEVDVIPLKHLIRFMFKEKRRIKRDKRYALEIKFELAAKSNRNSHLHQGMSQRTRYEGFGETASVIKLHNGDSATFSFDGDRYIAEIYFIPGENLERIAMIPLRTDFIRKLSEASPSPLKLHGSRWTS